MSETADKHYPWNEGQPTKPDVDALMAAYPPDTIQPGRWRVHDDEVRALIGQSEGSRYRTVYGAWVSRLARDHAVILFREKESGFYCPTPEQVFANTHPALEAAGRKIGKQLRKVSVVRPATEVERKTQEHQGRLLHAAKHEVKKARLNVLPSLKPQEQRPQITPPASSRAK